MADGLPHKLRRALGVSTNSQKRRKPGPEPKAAGYRGEKTLEREALSPENVMVHTPPQETFKTRIMGWPDTHQDPNWGESENWSFDRPR